MILYRKHDTKSAPVPVHSATAQNSTKDGQELTMVLADPASLTPRQSSKPKKTALDVLTEWASGCENSDSERLEDVKQQCRDAIVEMFLRVCLPHEEYNKITEETKKKRFQSIQEGSGTFKDFKAELLEWVKSMIQSPACVPASGAEKKLDDLHVERIKRNAVSFTIWNAMNFFGFESGQSSWRVVEAVVQILSAESLTCPWMRGDERGVFGETPLHLALLCNKPGQEGFDKMFDFLWTKCDKLRHLGYTGGQYQGENILHLAIVKGYGIEFFKKILSCDSKDRGPGAGAEYTRSRAVGTFFENPEFGCQLLGELPLFFAACSNQPKMFEHLVEHDVCLLLDVTSRDRNNLLHVLVLKEKADTESGSESIKDPQRTVLASDSNAKEDQQRLLEPLKTVWKILKGKQCIVRTSSDADEGSEADNKDPGHDQTRHSGTDGPHSAEDSNPTIGQDSSLTPTIKAKGPVRECPTITIVDTDEGTLNGGRRCNVFDALLKQKNADGLSPLELAAKEGSARMFCHLFDNEMTTAWVFGQVTCKRMYIDGIDSDIPEDPAKGKAGKAAHKECDVRPQSCKSVLDLLTEQDRSDILSKSCIDKLVEIKWRKYGEVIFVRKLYLSLFIASLTFLLPVIKFDESIAWRLLHSLNHAFVAFSIYSENKREQSRHTALFSVLFDHPKIKSANDVLMICIKMVMELCCFIFYDGAVATMKGLSEAVRSVLTISPSPDNYDKSDSKETHTLNAPAKSTATLALRDNMSQWISYLLLLSFSFRAWGLPLVPEEACSSWFHPDGNLVLAAQVLETALYAVLGYVNFRKFIYFVVATDQGYGMYVQMLLDITCTDLPIFFAIYTIVLLIFSYCHFLASSHVFSGVKGAMLSIWGIFSAMIGRFNNEGTLVAQEGQDPFRHLVTAISVANYFLVTVFLVNLLIAQFSHTFDRTRDSAEGVRKLQRARIVDDIDRAMSPEQRLDPRNVFWYTGSDGRRCVEASLALAPPSH
jgi:hypothetical protein